MKKEFWLSLIVLIIMLIVMRWQGQTLITPMSPLGIIDLEFAKTIERLNLLKLFMNEENVRNNIYLDFIFIATYAWFFILAIHALSVSGWWKWKRILLVIVVSAGMLDVIENFLILSVLQQPSQIQLQLIYFTAIVKFAAVGVILIYLLISFINSLLSKKTKRQAASFKNSAG